MATQYEYTYVEPLETKAGVRDMKDLVTKNENLLDDNIETNRFIDLYNDDYADLAIGNIIFLLTAY